MPRGPSGGGEELSEFEKQRAANIAERDALLKKLTAEAQTTGLFPKPAPVKKKAAPKKPKPEKKEPTAPRRTSARLAGLTADSEIAKRKADQQYEQEKRDEQAKRMRISGDLNVGDIVVGGQGWNGTGLGTDIVRLPARPHVRTFGEDDVKQTTDKELKVLRERMSGLNLWDQWEPNRKSCTPDPFRSFYTQSDPEAGIKITPERIYAMQFHPTESKPLIFAGDKLGNLGILDASQAPEDSVKREEEDEDQDDPDPVITTIKPHTRTISAMHFHPMDPSKLYTASYDSSIRALDLEKSVAAEVYAPASPSAEEPLSGVDMAPEDPHVAYFTTLDGVFGHHDLRTKSDDKSGTVTYQLSDKKIGGFSLCPTQPHYFATASLDRSMRLWDLRKLAKKHPTPVGEHVSSLSVSHAAFNSSGQVATTSYDNSVKIYDFNTKGFSSWKPGHTIPDEEMNPDRVIRHNCQTGRWVTMYGLFLFFYPPAFIFLLFFSFFFLFFLSSSLTHTNFALVVSVPNGRPHPKIPSSGSASET